MSFSSACRHNQSLVISAVITILAFAGILACHLTQPQKQSIIDTTVAVAETAAPVSPTPWREILLTISALLGSGSVIDNRRKDILIKRLKNENADALKLLTKLVAPANNNSTRAPPLCNN